ncbi:hypothetical protein [Candidatus Nitrososphaera evergladensis]|nr:hypothetical protein [Candidatus Nitrososphaera evergladensis]
MASLAIGHGTPRSFGPKVGRSRMSTKKTIEIYMRKHGRKG